MAAEQRTLLERLHEAAIEMGCDFPLGDPLAAEAESEIRRLQDFPQAGDRLISAENFLETVSVNINNKKLSDADFREFVRNTLPIVRYGKGS